MKLFLATIILFWSFSLLADWEVKEEKLTLSTSGISKIEMDCGSGKLEVRGKSGLSEIRVTAEIKMKNVRERDMERFMERNIVLRLEKRGNRAYLKSEVDGSWFSSSRQAVIDLYVEVPDDLPLDIDDGSGSMEVSDIKNDLSIIDGSGSLDVFDITGNVDIDDGSGSVVVANIEGDVRLDDGSGSLSIRRVNGNVEVSDGSGSININYVTADVYIRESGSGGLSIRNVDGNVTKDD